MLTAANAGAGMNMGFPDVCTTPVGPVPTPIPYPNMAMNAQAVPFAQNVLLSAVPALTAGSEIPMTLGDQAGTLSPFGGPGKYTMGNPVVKINGQAAISLTCPTTGNDMINAVGAVQVPSVCTVFFSDASGPTPGVIDAAAMVRLARALKEPAGASQLSAEGVAILAVPVFSSGLPAHVYAAVRRIGVEKIRALVLDLRGCPGGDLAAAIELAGDFLPEGTVLATVTDGDGDETVYRARSAPLYELPLVILIDGRTASAAEVFAGCLQAHGRAVVAGERSYGKDTVQVVVPGGDREGVRYATVAKVTIPNGIPIDGCGLRPDL